MQIQKTIPCGYCNGAGTVDNPAYRGKLMKAMRKAAQKTLTEVARRMGFSKAYISDLELGRRAWNPGLIAAYQKALK